MIGPRFVPLIVKQVVRQRTRSLLTILGVATAMFLFATIQSIQAGMRDATQQNAQDATLVVYRENRFCPFTSQLPEDYGRKIARISGVKSVVPMRIVVSNCRTSLDVVTFRGVPPEDLEGAYAHYWTFVAGSVAEWKRRSDSALVGHTLAERRGLSVGDRFEANGVTVSVAGIINSTQAQDANVAYVQLDFLQLQPGVKRDGIVTQFNVGVRDPTKMEEVAAAIDAEFKTAQEPTSTRSEKAFVAHSAGDLMELIGFTRWVGLGCVFAVLALVANTIVLSVQDRVKEHAVLQTLGFKGHLIARLIIGEGLVVSLLGGVVGTTAAVAFLRWGSFSLSNEGLSINFGVGPEVWASGLVVSVALGVLAGLVPAIQASRRQIAASFRAV